MKNEIEYDAATDKFILHLTSDNEVTHRVTLPVSEAGANTMRDLLRRRSWAKQNGISSYAAPTQRQTEAILAEWQGEITKCEPQRIKRPTRDRNSYERMLTQFDSIDIDSLIPED